MIESYNNEILAERGKGKRLVIPLNKEKTDTDFEILFSVPEFQKNFKILCEGYEKFRKDNLDGINGFNIFGSWINGQPDPDSDLDACFLLPDYLKFEKVKYFSGNEIHPICKSGEEEVIFSDIRSIIRNPNYSKNEIHTLKFILNGLPFGKEMQFFQRKILEYIENLSEEDRKIFWEVFSKNIQKSEQGYPTLRSSSQKYWLASFGNLTSEEFKKRWQKRCEFANKFCEENGIEL